MGKRIQCVFIVLVASSAIAAASPARLERLKPSKSKFLARQEVSEDVPAQTPYPPAGIKPAIPFNLPTDEKLVAPVNYYLPPLTAAANFRVPAEVYGPPAKTYGPPEVDVKVDAEAVDSDKPEQPEEQPQKEKPEEEKPEEEEPQAEKPEEDKPEEEKPEEEKPEEQSEEEQPSETTPKEVEPEEDDEVADVEPEEDDEVVGVEPEDTPKPDADSDSESEPEEDIIELEPVAVEEAVSNALSERLVLARVNTRKSAKLRSANSRSAKSRSAKLRSANLRSTKSRSAKLRSSKPRSAKLQLSSVVPLRREAITAQRLYLIGGNLYSYNGRLL